MKNPPAAKTRNLINGTVTVPSPTRRWGGDLPSGLIVPHKSGPIASCLALGSLLGATPFRILGFALRPIFSLVQIGLASLPRVSCSLPAPPTLCRWLVAWLLPTIDQTISVEDHAGQVLFRVRSRLHRPCVGGSSPGCYQRSTKQYRSRITLAKFCFVFAPGSTDLVSVARRLAATNDRPNNIGRVSRWPSSVSCSLPAPPTLCRWLVAWLLPTIDQTISVEDHAGQVLPRNRDRNGARPTFRPRRRGFLVDACPSADWLLIGLVAVRH